jgi:RimJ/RimL family protein N-acetyltransferase
MMLALHAADPRSGRGRWMTTSPDAGTIALTDGTVIPYRPILPADREALQRFHGRHSELAIYLRFFNAQRMLSEAQARHFTELDGDHRFALVALDPSEPSEVIAVVRYDREPGTDRAEYAAIVAGDWQGKGLGLGLTRRLIEAARRRGVRSFCAYVLPENLRMLNLLRDLGLPEEIHFEDGVERIDVLLDPISL